jgi:uncharacterized membrane protein
MTVLLLLAALGVLLIVLARTGQLNEQSARVERTLGALNNRVSALSAQLSRLIERFEQSPPAEALASELPGKTSTELPPTLLAEFSSARAAKIEESRASSAVMEEPISTAPVSPAIEEPLIPEFSADELIHAADAPDSEPRSDTLSESTPEPAAEPIFSEPASIPPHNPGAPPPLPPTHGGGLGDFERSFGTQWVVWVGGVALALGGIFLVRYSIEQGYFGPALRIAGGATLALVLVGLGELARRGEIVTGMAAVPTAAHIPSILTAAGTTCAYADVYAAYAVYDFLSPAIAFLLLGAVALATLAAALRHGPALGGLGLIGAYATPLLVSTIEPSYFALYVYLVVVTAAAFALARARMWRWLAITAAIISILWMFPGIAVPAADSLPAHAFYAMACFALAAIFIVPGLFQGPPAESGQYDEVSCGILAGYMVGAFVLVLATHHDMLAVATPFVLAAAAVAIAWRTESAIMAMPVAAILATLIVVHWAAGWFFVLAAPEGPVGSLLQAASGPVLAGRGLHIGFATAIAVLFGLSGYFAQGRSRQPMFSILWATVAAATPLMLIAIVYYRITQFDRSLPFAGFALLLAALFALATELLWKRRPWPGSAAVGAIFATAAVAGLALTLTFALEKGWLTIGLSLMVPGIAWIAERRPLALLRKLCGGIAAIVLARVTWDLKIVGDDFGSTPIFNWILYGYGLPAVAFWSGARILRRRADDVSVRSVESAAILFTALTAFLEIRHEWRQRIRTGCGNRRTRPSGLDRPRDGHRPRTHAGTQQQHRARLERAHSRRAGLRDHRGSIAVPAKPAAHRRAGRRPLLQ